MAKKTERPENATVVFPMELTLRGEDAAKISALVEGPESEARKVAAVAQGLLDQLAEGGMMLSGPTMRAMAQSIDRPIGNPEEIVELIEKGAQRKGGKYSFTIHLDPAYAKALEDSITFNGFQDAEQALQNLWDTFWDRGDCYVSPEPLRRLVMVEQDYQDLKEIFGKEVASGTELVQAIREWAKREEAGLFAEVER